MNRYQLIACLPLFASAVHAQDTIVVQANNPPVWGEAVTLVEELRIGALDGAPEEMFGEITGLVVDAKGVVWVADRWASTIRRFGHDGSYLGSVGQGGDGPREFRAREPIRLERAPDGRIVAYQPLRSRSTASVFSSDGAYLAELSLNLVTAPDVLISLRIDTAGVPYVLTYLDRRRAAVWLRPRPSGDVLDTLFIPSRDDVSSGGKGYPFGHMKPYTAVTLSALSPHGYLVTGRTDTYALVRPLRDGRVVRIERAWRPIRARDEERAQFEQQLATMAKGNAREGFPAPLSAEIPADKPPFWAMQVDGDGRIWVARHQEGYFRAETPEEKADRERPMPRVPTQSPTEWWEPLVTDVIEPSGRFLGTVRWPNNRASLAAAHGDFVWAIERGPLDEQYVVRYRIQHP